ncbi:Ca-activated chloride channel family protein [Cupriavidus plantarum]|uniref:Ca-activated chloride channel family protein n=2 Tax=Cupriavidus plantarum TaxID=942865 RepID=A0A316ERB7_9BURK|nr:Ca-activated chloride channel family protein [Cupriavidus plantarum]REE87650.1 Ca-activated chloride channel family protein [Cupriavidus plantarum]RLK30084.1 Ca-activated chloride channel family protein [Cupriavidus plantarum]
MDAIDRLPVLSFLWPSLLWLLALVLLLAVGYVWLDKRRRRTAIAYPALKTIGPAQTSGAGWRRHVPPVLALLGLTSLVVAIARPQAIMTLPSRIETVILVIDLSGSMRAQDVKPSRIRAAQQAAKVLVDAQPSRVSTGVVAMAGTAALAQAPSRHKDEVTTAIDKLQPQGGTALGNGLLIALTALLPQLNNDAARMLSDDDDAIPVRKPKPAANGAAGGSGSNAGPPPEAAQPGSYAAGAIVLFSDGESNAGPAALQAAQLAAENGVRIYTVGVGTTDGVVLKVDGLSSRVKLDEQALKQVADATSGQYFRLEDASKLTQVYEALHARLSLGKRDQIEVTAFFAALGAILATIAGMLSLWWFGRVL